MCEIDYIYQHTVCREQLVDISCFSLELSSKTTDDFHCGINYVSRPFACNWLAQKSCGISPHTAIHQLGGSLGNIGAERNERLNRNDSPQSNSRAQRGPFRDFWPLFTGGFGPISWTWLLQIGCVEAYLAMRSDLRYLWPIHGRVTIQVFVPINN